MLIYRECPYGPPGSRQHIWSFVGGEYEQDDSRFSRYKCPVVLIGPIKYLHLLTMTTFVILGIQVPLLNITPFTMRILYGMAWDVAVTAPAVNSTLPHGSMHLYLNLLTRT